MMTANAQAQVKSYIGLYGGLSFAQSEFASTNYNNNHAGFAKRGVIFSIDGAYYIHKSNFGIGATFSFQDNGELNNTDAVNLATGYTNSYKSNGTTVTSVNRYHNYNILVGPQYSFVIKKFTIDIRASAGYLRSTSTPNITTFVADVPNQPGEIIQESSTGAAFAYGGNVGLRFAFADNWFVALKGAYVNSPGIKIGTTGRTLNEGRVVTKQPITVIQSTLGIVHSF